MNTQKHTKYKVSALYIPGGVNYIQQIENGFQIHSFFIVHM